MATLSSTQVAALARSVGLTGEPLVTAVAVAWGESGLRTDARGDVALVNAKWGPSIGLWQIRSINADRGTGRTRDELANLDPAHNAQAMMEISGRGGNFGAWTVYTSGAYRAHLPGAIAAVKALGEAVPLIDLGTWKVTDDAGANVGTFPGSGLVEGALDAAGNVIGTVTKPITSVADFLGAISSKEFWWRVGKGALGVGLIVGAVGLLKPDLVADLATGGATAII